MCGTESENTTLRVEVIDSWHRRWPDALKSIDGDGRRAKLMIDADGWLSARQCLLIAFEGEDRVAGHLLFRLSPSPDGPRPIRPKISAHLDDLSVRTGFDAKTVRKLLVETAKLHARSLQVKTLVDFE